MDTAQRMHMWLSSWRLMISCYRPDKCNRIWIGLYKFWSSFSKMQPCFGGYTLRVFASCLSASFFWAIEPSHVEWMQSMVQTPTLEYTHLECVCILTETNNNNYWTKRVVCCLVILPFFTTFLFFAVIALAFRFNCVCVCVFVLLLFFLPLSS